MKEKEQNRRHLGKHEEDMEKTVITVILFGLIMVFLKKDNAAALFFVSIFILRIFYYTAMSKVDMIYNIHIEFIDRIYDKTHYRPDITGAARFQLQTRLSNTLDSIHDWKLWIWGNKEYWIDNIEQILVKTSIEFKVNETKARWDDEMIQQMCEENKRRNSSNG